VLPDTQVTIVHGDGKTAWTADNTSLKFDGVAVTPTFTKDANIATITYKPGSLLASKSTHTITVGHPDPAGQPATTEWSFEVAEYRGPLLDEVRAIQPSCWGRKQTDDQGAYRCRW
jgi:hypothetical protein